MTNHSDWTFEWINDWDTIYSEEFQQWWLDFIEHADDPHVFFHPALSMAWLDTYRPLRNLEPWFCIGRKGETQVFMPFVLWRRNWKNAFQKLLIPVGYSDYDYHDPLVQHLDESTSPKHLNEIIRLALKSNSKIRYDNVCVDGIRQALQQNNKNKVEAVLSIDLREVNHHDILSSLVDKKTLADTMRQRRRLLAQGKISFIRNNFNYDQKLIIDELNAMYRKRWPNAYQPPMYLENIFSRCNELDLIDLSALQINSQSIAWHFGFKYNKIIYYYRPLADYTWENYSPGRLLLSYLVEDCAKKGDWVIDLLRGAESYKKKWSNSTAHIVEFVGNGSAWVSKVRNSLVGIKSKYLT